MLVALLGVLFNAGCADAGADHMLLDRFFAASRLLDRTELARFATVVFEPGRDGIVEQFTVVAAAESREPSAAAAGLDSHRSRTRELSLAEPTSLESRPPVSGVTLVTRDVTVAARLRLPDGTVSARTLDVTLQCAEAPAGQGGRGRWIVTAVRGRR